MLQHMSSCCLLGGKVKYYKLPFNFDYKLNAESLKRGTQFSCRLIGMEFDNNVFFLKVAKQERKWFIYVQMIGNKEEAAGYTSVITVFKPEFGPDGRYSQRNMGDVAPIDIKTLDEAEEAGYCLPLRDAAISKFVDNSTLHVNVDVRKI